jgi:flagellar biosynthesis protein FlhF
MRLKTFTASTMGEAMTMVRETLGPEAIIVSTQNTGDGRGVALIAAIDETTAGDAAPLSSPLEDDAPDVVETVRQALAFHGTPQRLIERLAQAAGALEAGDVTLAFAGAVDAGFAFRPLGDADKDRPTMLVGPPGAGKTITTAKLAARTVLAKRPVNVVSIDSQRAGGVEQLSAFTRILGLGLVTAATASALAAAIAANPAGVRTYIDTPGTNPFDDAEMERLATFVDAAKAEPVLVLPAGGDAMETAEIAAAFAGLGARRMIVTRLDAARRLGSILAAADAAHLSFAHVSVTPHVANGLSPINPVSLARLILPRSESASPLSQLTEAQS